MIIHIQFSPTTLKQILKILIFIYLLTYISDHYHDFQVLDEVISNAQPIFKYHVKYDFKKTEKNHNPCNPLFS